MVRGGSPGTSPVDAELIAGQVVGADAEHPDLGREEVGHYRSCRNLDHRGHQGDPAAGACGDAFEGRPHRPNLTGLGDHRDQEPQLGRVAGLEDRLELRGEPLDILQEEFHAAPVDSFKEGGRLVTPEIEQANGRGEAAERGQRRFKGPAVLGRGRPVVGLQEGELGAKQSDPIGARLERGADLGGCCGIGEHPYQPPVASNGRQRSSGHCPAVRIAGGGDRAPDCIHSRAVGRRDDHALTCIDNAGLTLDQRKKFVAYTDHHRDPEPTSHDGRMAGHASHRKRDAGHVAVELDDVGRAEIRRNQDGLTRRQRTCAAGPARCQPRCAPSEAPHVRGAGGKFRITECVELLCD